MNNPQALSDNLIRLGSAQTNEKKDKVLTDVLNHGLEAKTMKDPTNNTTQGTIEHDCSPNRSLEQQIP